MVAVADAGAQDVLRRVLHAVAREVARRIVPACVACIHIGIAHEQGESSARLGTAVEQVKQIGLHIRFNTCAAGSAYVGAEVLAIAQDGTDAVVVLQHEPTDVEGEEAAHGTAVTAIQVVPTGIPQVLVDDVRGGRRGKVAVEHRAVGLAEVGVELCGGRGPVLRADAQQGQLAKAFTTVHAAGPGSVDAAIHPRGDVLEAGTRHQGEAVAERQQHFGMQGRIPGREVQFATEFAGYAEVRISAGGPASLLAAQVLCVVSTDAGRHVGLSPHECPVAAHACFHPVVQVAVAVHLTFGICAGQPADGIGFGDSPHISHAVAFGNGAEELHVHHGALIGAPFHGGGGHVPRQQHPVAGPCGRACIPLQQLIRKSSRLLLPHIRVGVFQAQFELARCPVLHSGMPGAGVVSAVGPPAIGAAVVQEGVVAPTPLGAAERIVAVEEPIGTHGLPGLERDGTVLRALFQHEVHQPPELWTIGQRGCTAHHFDAVQSRHGRCVVGFRITEHIGRDIEAVLPHVELPAAVGAQAAGGDAQLHAASIVLPHGDAGYFGEHLPGLVLREVGRHGGKQDRFRALSSHDHRAQGITGGPLTELCRPLHFECAERHCADVVRLLGEKGVPAHPCESGQ